MKSLKKIFCIILCLCLLVGTLAACGSEEPIKGEKGEQGIQGEKGEQGIQGEKGEQGIQGEKGEQGIQGEKGEQGIQGEKGEQGIQGEKGEQGIQGEKGEQGIQGEKGEQGLQGEKGEQGLQGEKGEQGNDGKSAFELYRDTYGYEGTETEWLEELICGTLITYTVTFELNGGTATEGYADSVIVPAGKLLTLSEPTREGYTFLGWYTGESVNDGIVTTTTPIREDMNLIAKWRINVLTVTFYDRNGEILSHQNIEYGSEAEAPTAPTINKLVFSKWDTDFSAVTENLSVRPIYVPNTYTLSFDTDGGTSITAQEYYVGDIPVKPRNPIKTGHYFIGWYLDEGLTNEYRFDTALNANTTLYAKFLESMPIYTAADLKAIKNQPSAKYYLANDINLDGEIWEQISTFSGVLNGEGHKIYNFTMSSTEQTSGFVKTNTGTIENLTLSDFSFTVATDGLTTMEAGALVGKNSGNIKNCHISDAVLSYSYYKSSNTGKYSYYAGGLVGTNSGTIDGCSITAEIGGEGHMVGGSSSYSTSYIYGYYFAGGVAGKNDGSILNTMTNVTMNIKSIAVALSSYAYTYSYLNLGGAIGYNQGEVYRCESTAGIFIEEEQSGTHTYRINMSGGFVSENNGTISESCASGTIQDETVNFYVTNIGGFAACNYETIKNSYTDVDMTIQSPGNIYCHIGGFISTNEGSIASCYTMSDITTAATAGSLSGFVGETVTGSSISKCFNAGNITLTVDTDGSKLGYFVGVANTGATFFKNYYNSEMTVERFEGGPVVPGVTSGAEGTTALTLQSKTLLVDTLSWSEEVWTLRAGEYPCLAWEIAE